MPQSTSEQKQNEKPTLIDPSKIRDLYDLKQDVKVAEWFNTHKVKPRHPGQLLVFHVKTGCTALDRFTFKNRLFWQNTDYGEVSCETQGWGLDRASWWIAGDDFVIMSPEYQVKPEEAFGFLKDFVRRADPSFLEPDPVPNSVPNSVPEPDPVSDPEPDPVPKSVSNSVPNLPYLLSITLALFLAGTVLFKNTSYPFQGPQVCSPQ
jgi:hypothetical protein